MSFTIWIKSLGWVLTGDFLKRESGVEFKIKPEFYWEENHRGIHWLGCNLCLER
jgi:hypothetical protein